MAPQATTFASSVQQGLCVGVAFLTGFTLPAGERCEGARNDLHLSHRSVLHHNPRGPCRHDESVVSRPLLYCCLLRLSFTLGTVEAGWRAVCSACSLQGNRLRLGQPSVSLAYTTRRTYERTTAGRLSRRCLPSATPESSRRDYTRRQTGAEEQSRHRRISAQPPGGILTTNSAPPRTRQKKQHRATPCLASLRYACLCPPNPAISAPSRNLPSGTTATDAGLGAQQQPQ